MYPTSPKPCTCYDAVIVSRLLWRIFTLILGLRLKGCDEKDVIFLAENKRSNDLKHVKRTMSRQRSAGLLDNPAGQIPGLLT